MDNERVRLRTEQSDLLESLWLWDFQFSELRIELGLKNGIVIRRGGGAFLVSQCGKAHEGEGTNLSGGAALGEEQDLEVCKRLGFDFLHSGPKLTLD